jgi:putative transposase
MNQKKESTEAVKNLDRVIKIDEARIHSHLDEMVRDTVQETLNKMLDAEADRLCNAQRYEHTEGRMDTRAGPYARRPQTRAGLANLKVPRLRKATLEMVIIERYRRRESSVEEALIQMYLAGVSVRRIEDITQALWGTRISPGTVNELSKKVYGRIELWRNRRIEGSYPYIYLDGLCLKRSWGGEVRNVSILVAVGVDEDGFREILGICEGAKEDEQSWSEFFRHLKQRGLKGVELVISDKCLGLLEAVGKFYPDANWQRCMVHWYRNVFSVVPNPKVKQVAVMLKAIHAQEDKEAALEKAQAVADKLKQMKLYKACQKVQDGVEETLRYMSYPREQWRRIRTNNMLEQVMREIRRRTNVVGCFPDGSSALMLAAGGLRHIAGTKWSTYSYLNMKRLKDQQTEQEFQLARVSS